MWGIIIATITGTGIGLSAHVFHAWYKQRKKIKQQKRRLEKELFRKDIENMVLNYLKQLQKDDKNGNTTSTKETSKKK